MNKNMITNLRRALKKITSMSDEALLREANNHDNEYLFTEIAKCEHELGLVSDHREEICTTEFQRITVPVHSFSHNCEKLFSSDEYKCAA